MTAIRKRSPPASPVPVPTFNTPSIAIPFVDARAVPTPVEKSTPGSRGCCEAEPLGSVNSLGKSAGLQQVRRQTRAAFRPVMSEIRPLEEGRAKGKRIKNQDNCFDASARMVHGCWQSSTHPDPTGAADVCPGMSTGSSASAGGKLFGIRFAHREPTIRSKVGDAKSLGSGVKP